MDTKRLHRDLSEALHRLARDAEPFPADDEPKPAPRKPRAAPDLSGLHTRKIAIDDEEE